MSDAELDELVDGGVAVCGSAITDRLSHPRPDELIRKVEFGVSDSSNNNERHMLAIAATS